MYTLGWGIRPAPRRPGGRRWTCTRRRAAARPTTGARRSGGSCNKWEHHHELQIADCRLQIARTNLQSAICNLQSRGGAMSGHSHWATIKHKKAAVDAKRGKLWSKLSRAII